MSKANLQDTGYVSGRFLDDLLRTLSRSRIDVGSLVAGLEIDRSADGRQHRLVDWDRFVEVMSRLELQVGGSQAMIELGERATDLKPAAILRRLAGLSASPLVVYRAGARWALRRAIPLLESELTLLADGRLRVISVIPAPHRPCAPLLHLAVGALRAAPRILNLPDAVVTADVQPSRGVYTVVLPSSGTIPARFRRAFRALFSSRAAFDQLEVQQGEIESHFLELRAAYAVLEESEARHRALTESAVDIVSEVDVDGRLHYVSPSLEALLGFRSDEVIGQNFSDFIHPDDLPAVLEEFSELLSVGNESRPVFRMRTKQEGWRWFEVESNTYSTSEGELRAVSTLREVTSRIELEREREERHTELEREVARRTAQLERRNLELRELQSLLLQAERMGTAQDLAGQVAHSINNPLGALIGHLQLALHDSDGDDERLGRVLDLACRVRDVVQRTLELYREGKVDRAPVCPVSLVEEVADDLEGRATLCNVEVRIDAGADLPNIDADRALLGSALVALAENAIEAMEGGGNLKLSVRLASGASAVEFRIVDDGPGIPAEIRDRIFDPFFTTKAEGTGLGLAIARGVVLGHDGEIAIEERPGGGSAVSVRIPLEAPRP